MQHSFENTRILVFGDLMLDRYWSGHTSRISPEAPVPVVHIREFEERVGGSGNVALNITALGGQASLVALTGADDNGALLKKQLQAHKVDCLLHTVDAPTITKLRVLSRHQQLIRLDFEETFHNLNTTPAEQQFESALKAADAVIFSDYGKGTLADVQTLIQKAKQAQKPVLIDPKGTSFDHYRGATVITPNFNEFTAVVGPIDSDATLEKRAKELIARLDLQALLITRGEAGMTLVQNNQATIHIPALAREVFDVTGAGDTVIATLGLALASGYDFRTAINIANAAASVAVSKLGTSTVSLAELEEALHHRNTKQTEQTTGIMSETELLEAVRLAHVQGENIVMTNGCFDLLHAGHVDYLQKARALGDRLIVAVNDDASIQRLKGASRPVVPLQARMQVLNALGCVDWVVPFSEDTPERLISTVLPDTLVKGKDYEVHEIAGAKQVLANGGAVETIALVPNCSTSSIIDKIKDDG